MCVRLSGCPHTSASQESTFLNTHHFSPCHKLAVSLADHLWASMQPCIRQFPCRLSLPSGWEWHGGDGSTLHEHLHCRVLLDEVPVFHLTVGSLVLMDLYVWIIIAWITTSKSIHEYCRKNDVNWAGTNLKLHGTHCQEPSKWCDGPISSPEDSSPCPPPEVPWVIPVCSAYLFLHIHLKGKRRQVGCQQHVLDLKRQRLVS